MTDAPFVIRPPIFTSDDKPNERNRAGPSFGTVLSKDGKAEGNLYWNHEIVSSALVCGASVRSVPLHVYLSIPASVFGFDHHR